MKKRNIIILMIFILLSSIFILLGESFYNYNNNNLDYMLSLDEYLSGSATGQKGKIGLKIKIDNSGTIREVHVTEKPKSEIAEQALQKLIDNSIDKQYADEIDAVSGATDTSNTYRSIISNLLFDAGQNDIEENKEMVSLTEPENQANIERIPINEEGYKSGLGGFVFNTFQDADYNRNGNLVTNEYICGVILNPHNNIEQVKFDHIVSNISFDRFGRIPTGGAKAYVFASDKSKSGFNGLINDGNYIDIFEFEKQVLTLRRFEEVKNKFLNKKGYTPLVNALENAIENARYIGASKDEPMGLSVNKILKKRDILDSTNDTNGKVNFVSNYCLITSDKSNKISSCMFDYVVNNVTLTGNGKILGSREKEIRTLNELANTQKYSKIDSKLFNIKLQLNALGDFLRGDTIDERLRLISRYIDDKGAPKPNEAFRDLKNIDFIEYINLISDAFVDSVKIGSGV